MIGVDKENCDTGNGVGRTFPARPFKGHDHSSMIPSSFAEAGPFKIEVKSRLYTTNNSDRPPRAPGTPLKQRQKGTGATGANGRRRRRDVLVASISKIVSHKPKAKKYPPRRVSFNMVPSPRSISTVSSCESPRHLDQDISLTLLSWESDETLVADPTLNENRGSALIKRPYGRSEPLRPKTPTKVPHHLSPFYPEKYLALARRTSGERQLQFDEDAADVCSGSNIKETGILQYVLQPDVDSAANVKQSMVKCKCWTFIKQNGVCIIALAEAIVSVYPLVVQTAFKSAVCETNSKSPTTAINKVMRASLWNYSESFSAVLSSATMGGAALIYEKNGRSRKAVLLSSLSKTFTEKVTHVVELCVGLIAYNSQDLRPLRLVFLDTAGLGWHEYFRDMIHVLFLVCITYQTVLWALKQSRVLFRKSDFATRLPHTLKNSCSALVFGLLLASLAMLVPSFELASALDGTGPYQLFSILDACLFNLNTAVHQQLNVHLDAGLLTVVGRVTSFAFSNPAQFMFYLNRVRVGVRWISFLAPLIGTSNKLRGHALDLNKKRAQLQRSVHANLNWQALRFSLKRQYIMEDAAIILQAKFRERRERKTLHVLRLWNHQEYKEPGEKLNLWLKQKAAHARKRVERSKSFEVAAEDRSQSSSCSLSSCVMTPHRKRRKLGAQSTLSISQEERMLLLQTTQGFLESRVEQERRVFLMKPNTHFAVAWKVATVSCILLELLHKALAPTVLSDQGQEKMTMDAFLNAALLKQSDIQFRTVLSSIGISDLSASGVQQFLLSLIHCFWVMVARIIVLTVPCIVTLVCFADVFVTFFTGEVVENANGSDKRLMPKSFFARWVLPGVGLQLIVNPTMGSVATGLKACLQLSRDMGHCRTMWIIVLGVLPLGNSVLDSVTYFVWKSILIKQK